MSTYVIQPELSEGTPKPKAAVLIATDAFGYTLVNSRLIADAFAKETGVICIMPDLFGAIGPLPHDLLEPLEKRASTEPLSLWQRVSAFPRKAVGMARLIWVALNWFPRQPVGPKVQLIETVMTAATEKYGVSKFGAQGYCYGGKLVALLGAKADGPVTAIALAHPSLLKVEDIRALTVPQLWLCAEKDMAFSDKLRIQAEAICKEKEASGGPTAAFHLFPGTEHGFAVRGNDADPAVKTARESAFAEAVDFFKTHLL